MKDNTSVYQAEIAKAVTKSTSKSKGGQFHCSLQIPNDCMGEIGYSDERTKIELNLPLGGEFDLSQLISQLEETQLSRSEKDGLLEEIHTMIDQTMVGAFLRRYLVFDK